MPFNIKGESHDFGDFDSMQICPAVALTITLHSFSTHYTAFYMLYKMS